MNKTVNIIVAVAVVGVLAFLAFGGQAAQGVTQSVVEMPSQLQTFLLGLVMAGTAWLFSQLFMAVPWIEQFLGQYVDEVGAFLGATLIAFIQKYLNMIPPSWEGVGNIVMALIVEVLIVLGFIQVARKVGVSIRVAVLKAWAKN